MDPAVLREIGSDPVLKRTTTEELDMEQRPEAKSTDRTAMTPRTQPIPLADRRRLLRPSEVAEQAPQPVITDWASI